MWARNVAAVSFSSRFLFLSPFLNLNHPLSSVNIPKEDNLILRKVLANDFWYWKVLQRQICYRYVFVPTRAQVIVKLLFRLVVRNLPESFQVLYSPPYCGNALHLNAAARSLCGFDSSFEWSRNEPDCHGTSRMLRWQLAVLVDYWCITLRTVRVAPFLFLLQLDIWYWEPL